MIRGEGTYVILVGAVGDEGEPRYARPQLVGGFGTRASAQVRRLRLLERAERTTAAGLRATEGIGEVDGLSVHADGFGADALRQGRAALLAVGTDAPGEPLPGVIGDARGLDGVAVEEDREHRAEDLFSCDGHIVVAIGEDRRPDVPAVVQLRRAPAAHGQTRQVTALGEVTLDAFVLPTALQRDRGGFPDRAGSTAAGGAGESGEHVDHTCHTGTEVRESRRPGRGPTAVDHGVSEQHLHAAGQAGVVQHDRRRPSRRHVVPAPDSRGLPGRRMARRAPACGLHVGLRGPRGRNRPVPRRRRSRWRVGERCGDAPDPSGEQRAVRLLRCGPPGRATAALRPFRPRGAERSSER